MISIPSCFDKHSLKLNDFTSHQNFLQQDYDDHFSAFMSTAPICPHCLGKLHKHDSFPRSFYCVLGKIQLVCRRVYCPHCGQTHRVLPSYIIPGYQILSDDADLLTALVLNDESCTVFSLDSLLSFSALYLFFNKIKHYFHPAIPSKSFYALFPFQNIGHYRRFITDFFRFQIFQLDIGCSHSLN